MFHNNPVKIANYERKLIWPDTNGYHPDILLSIGTGHNGKDTGGSVEVTRRIMKSTIDIVLTSDIQDRRQGFKTWFRAPTITQFLNIMVNRAGNILNSEQIWRDFRNEVLDSNFSIDGQRYERLNPSLGFPPPRIDEKAQVGYLQRTVADRIRRQGSYQLKIQRIAHRLIASSFYFERLAPTRDHESGYTCTGKEKSSIPTYLVISLSI